MERVRVGQRVRLPAATWNRVLDGTETAERLAKSADAGRFRPSYAGMVLVRNSSGAPVNRLGVLGIDGVEFARADNPDEFDAGGFVLTGGTPDADLHAGRFVVTAEPIADGAVGHAYAVGLCAAKVHIVAAGDAWADVADADATQLTSGPAGSARIVYADAGTGSQWAVVQLAASGLPPVPDPAKDYILAHDTAAGLCWIETTDECPP